MFLGAKRPICGVKWPKNLIAQQLVHSIYWPEKSKTGLRDCKKNSIFAIICSIGAFRPTDDNTPKIAHKRGRKT